MKIIDIGQNFTFYTIIESVFKVVKKNYTAACNTTNLANGQPLQKAHLIFFSFLFFFLAGDPESSFVIEFFDNCFLIVKKFAASPLKRSNNEEGYQRKLIVKEISQEDPLSADSHYFAFKTNTLSFQILVEQTSIPFKPRAN